MAAQNGWIGVASENSIRGDEQEVHGGEDHARARGKVVSAVAERLPAGQLEKGRILDELCAVVTRERGRTDEI
jgi:hypothetical protein